MKKFNKLFSRLQENLDNMKDRIIRFFNKIHLKRSKNRINNYSKKFKKLKKVFYDKVKFADEIIWIMIPCILTLFLVLILKSGADVEKYNITKNQGDVYYYEGNYDLAINEYNLIQKDEEWPEYSLEVSDIYSIKHEFEKSESILKESIIIRDRINKENTNIDNKKVDEDFINKILFIFNMNKDYDETIGLGEQYLSENGISNKVIKNIFTAYLIKNYEYKTEEILNKFIIDENSVSNKTEFANMKGLIGDFNGAVDLLNQAFNIDSDSILIYDTIEELTEFNSEALIKAIKDKDNGDISYKFMLAKVYSLSSDEKDINEAKDIYLQLRKGYKDKYILNLIAYSIYKDIDYLEDAYKNSKNAESYIEAYIKSLYKYKLGEFEDAENEAYKSITLKEDYNKVYILLADIMNSKGNSKASESYLREALEIKPYSYKTLIKMSDFYSSGILNEVKARYYLDMAINIKKEDSNLYYKLVKLDISTENYEDAILNLNKAIKIDPENNNYYRILGAVKFELESYDEGIEDIRLAYELNENDVLSLNNAAWFYANIERDVFRAYDNIKSALDGMPLSISEENKKIIIENYNRIKSLYESGEEDYTNMDLKLIY